VFDENSEKTFYDSEEERRVEEPKTYVMDPDHRLLLRNTKPLLQSRNTAVSTHTHTHTHTHWVSMYTMATFYGYGWGIFILYKLYILSPKCID